MSCSIRIDSDVITLNTEEAKKTVEKLLHEKKDSKRIFKIGMTNSSKIRVRRGGGHMATRKELKVYAQLGHEYGADQPWDEMYVVYKSESRTDVQALENELIKKYYWLTKPIDTEELICWNQRGGGAGRPTKSEYVGLHYVYVLFG